MGRIKTAFTTPKHFAECLPWDNRCKLLLHSCRRNYRDSVGAKDGSWVFTRKRNTNTRPILRHWTWPRAWNFLIYSCNLCFWSLLTLRGRCHWSNVALRRLLVLLPGDISFSVVHRAECSRASILQCSELKGRKKFCLSNISDDFNIE